MYVLGGVKENGSAFNAFFFVIVGALTVMTFAASSHRISPLSSRSYCTNAVYLYKTLVQMTLTSETFSTLMYHLLFIFIFLDLRRFVCTLCPMVSSLAGWTPSPVMWLFVFELVNLSMCDYDVMVEILDWRHLAIEFSTKFTPKTWS